MSAKYRRLGKGSVTNRGWAPVKGRKQLRLEGKGFVGRQKDWQGKGALWILEMSGAGPSLEGQKMNTQKRTGARDGTQCPWREQEISGGRGS